ARLADDDARRAEGDAPAGRARHDPGTRRRRARDRPRGDLRAARAGARHPPARPGQGPGRGARHAVGPLPRPGGAGRGPAGTPVRRHRVDRVLLRVRAARERRQARGRPARDRHGRGTRGRHAPARRGRRRERRRAGAAGRRAGGPRRAGAYRGRRALPGKPDGRTHHRDRHAPPPHAMTPAMTPPPAPRGASPAGGTAPLKVVIAEDAVILRDGLAHLLGLRGHEVVAGAAARGAAGAEHRPDVAVIDIRMPPTHTDEGLRAAIELRRELPGTGVLLFSQYVETRYAAELLGSSPAGVGYLLKERVSD